jgi:hypothetical protein
MEPNILLCPLRRIIFPRSAALILVKVVRGSRELWPPAHVSVHVMLLQSFSVSATSVAQSLLAYCFSVKVLNASVIKKSRAVVLGDKAVSLFHSLVL